MREGFARAALKLYELADTDREWVLTHLDATDREKLRRVVDRIYTRNARGIEPVVPRSVVETSFPRLQRPEEQVASASVERIVEVIADEADWVVALVMSRCDWPWSRDFLEQMDPDRVVHLHAAISAAGAQASEAVVDVAVRALAEQLGRVARNAIQGNGFDETVARLTGFSPGRARLVEDA